MNIHNQPVRLKTAIGIITLADDQIPPLFARDIQLWREGRLEYCPRDGGKLWRVASEGFYFDYDIEEYRIRPVQRKCIFAVAPGMAYHGTVIASDDAARFKSAGYVIYDGVERV